MKNTILLLTMFLMFSSVFAQTNEEFDADKYLKEKAEKNQINEIISQKDSLKGDCIWQLYENDLKALEGSYYNNAVLNKYFKEKATSFAFTDKDFSYTNFVINASTSDKTLTIGKNFILRNLTLNKVKHKQNKLLSPIQKVGNVLFVYTKSHLSNGFSNLYSKNNAGEYEFNSNIGVGVKYTHVFNGTINSSKKDAIKKIRENYVKINAIETIDKYDSESLEDDVTLQGYTSDKPENEIEKKQVQKKFFEFYEAIVDEELKYIKSEKLITSSHLTWISIESYIPLTDRKIKHSIDTSVVSTKNYRDYTFTATGNYLYSRNTASFFKDWSAKLTLQGSYFQTNNFKLNNQTASTFQDITQDNTTTVVEGSSESVFLGNYKNYWVTSLRLEGVTLFFNNAIGLSGAVEFVDSEIKDYKNWKLGIPFSLKDSEGKPTINFELQWKEVSEQHFVGLSVGYNFGKFLK